MSAYYNEIDPKAAAWLRELIKVGAIAPGDVDERDIRLVRPDELRGYRQCHFFAGVGVWSFALRQAGWEDGREVWTGSCPCQPFSAAGVGAGFEDERHLWPAWFALIIERRPGVVFGEQVAGKDGLAWLDLVQPDMENEGYAFAPLDLCAAGFGAPHIRQRLFFVAHADEGRSGRHAGTVSRAQAGAERSLRGIADGAESRGAARPVADTLRGGAGHTPGQGLGTQATSDGEDGHLSRERLRAGIEGATSTLDHAADARRARAREHGGGSPLQPARSVQSSGAACVLGDPNVERREGGTARPWARWRDGPIAPGAVNGFWGNAEWLACIDGKARPIEPGTFPLATGTPARLVRLRGYGNAINAEVATAFIEAYLDVINDISCEQTP